MTETGATAASQPERAEDYDRFVDWEKRLAREAPFFREVFSQHGVHTLVDVGCGTGRHAVMFAGWGLHVTGVDPDASMLAQARVNADSAQADVAFLEGGFGDLSRLLPAQVDSVTCTGNALPHVDGLDGLRSAVLDFASVLRPGGLLVLHLLNHDRLLAQEVRSIPPVVREGDGTWVFLRIMDYVPGAILFDFLTLHRPEGGWESGAAWKVSSRRSRHMALPSSLLAGELEAAGFRDIHLYGDHAFKTFEAGHDESVVITAVRG